MNEFPSEFELQLKQLQPTGCDELLADTFYRAGWAACEAQMPTSPRRPLFVGRRAMTSFGTGLLCGLLFAGGITLWHFSTVESDHAGERALTAPETIPLTPSVETIEIVERAVPEAVNPERNREDTWGALLADLSPWSVSGVEDLESKTPLAARPLSPAARYYWSSLVVSEPTSWHEGGNIASDESDGSTLPLRSFPATKRMIDELL